MKPVGISSRRTAPDIDVSRSRVSELANGQRPITADTALRQHATVAMAMDPRRQDERAWALQQLSN
jgi:plasmid maintenance system antidote protein VapI